MNLVERHIIDVKHSLYSECDTLCFKSKNIYNLSIYKIRQEFINNKSYNILNNLFHEMKYEDCYKELPSKVARATTILVEKNFKAFFKSLASYTKNPSKFLGNPNLPKYLDKEDGRFITTYNYQAISKKVFKKTNKIKLSGVDIEFYTKITNFDSIDCVRIVPRNNQYIIEVCYSIEDIKPLKDNNRYASIDIGLNNLASVTSNVIGLQPFLVKGTPLKSINQYYNKKLSEYKSKLEKINKKKSSKKIKKLTNKRTNKIDDYLHKSATKIVKELIKNNISKLVIGKNDNWKQDINLSSKNNQNFVSIPHSRFIEMLLYKCEKSGIVTILTEESYTSKASFLNQDLIPKYGDKHEEEYIFSGYRQSRGLYHSKEGKLINADINGSLNILRKAIPNAFADGIEGVVVSPFILT